MNYKREIARRIAEEVADNVATLGYVMSYQKSCNPTETRKEYIEYMTNRIELILEANEN